MKLLLTDNRGGTVSIPMRSDETLMQLKQRVKKEAGISLELEDIAVKEVVDYFLALGKTKADTQSNAHCAVPGCKNSKVGNPDKVFFEFPPEEIRCHQWVLYCQRSCTGPGKKRLRVTSESTICSDHFKPDQFIKNNKSLLKRTAVPSDQDYRLCRLCALSSEDYIYIFDETGRKLKIAEKINLCLPIKVEITDDLPKQICRKCLANLEDVFEMADTSSLAETKLLNMAKDEMRNELTPHGTGDDYILGTRKMVKNQLDPTNIVCPLCKEGKMKIIEKKEIEDERPSSIFCETLNGIEPLHLGDSGFKTNCIEKSDLFCVGGYPETISSKKLGEPLKNVTKHSESNHCMRTVYDTLDSQFDTSSQDFSKENYPLKLGSSSSKNDNDQISQSHSFTSRFHTMNADDSAIKILRDNCTSPINDNLQPDSDVYLIETESENSNVQSLYKSIHDSSETRFKFHMKSHESVTPAHCDICDKQFPDKIKLERHNINIHSTRKAHCCEECGKIFKTEASMRYHQKRAHQTDRSRKVKSYTCERCGKTFIRKSMLINHMTTDHKNNNETPCFCCKICCEGFPSTVTAVFHMDHHHKLECKNESTYSFDMHSINRLFMCEFCERCFAEGVALNIHRERHPADAPYECKFCDTSFASGEEIKIHRIHHSEDELPPEYLSDFTIPKTYLCEFCDRRFLNCVKYTEHLTVHYGPEPYQCPFCAERFSTVTESVGHRLTHGNMPSPTEAYNLHRPYECHYCNKTFAIEDALVKHIRMHTGEKPFICDQCGKRFSQSSGLYSHQKIHSTERPYICPICPRTFKVKGDRDIHVRKHSGARPYKCEFCSKAFMTQHVYSQHKKIHTGERPYKCDVCGIAFKRSHVLTVHKRIHTGEKPNICDVCGKRYRQKRDLLKHRRLHDGIPSSEKVLTALPC